MDKFKLTLLFCTLVCFYPLGLAQSANEASSSEALEQLPAEKIAAQHLLARLKANELIAQHKFGLARHTVRYAQQALISRQDDIPQTIFTFLKTLGSEKLLAIDSQELIFLRQRVASERAARAKLASKVPQPKATKALPAVPSTATAITKPALKPRLAVRQRRPVRRGLRTRLSIVQYDDTPLSEVLDDLRNRTGTNIVANWDSLANLGIDKSTAVSLQLRNVPAKLVLKLILQTLSNSQGRVSYVNQENVVFIASGEDLDSILELRIYEMAGLSMETKDNRGGPQFLPGVPNRNNSGTQSPR